MFGFVNQALQHLISRRFGEEKWEIIRRAANIEEDLKEGEEFLIRKLYSDEVTYRLVAAARKTLDGDISEVLQQFGEQFIEWCHEYGYDHLLTLLGGNLLEFLSNLDALHDHLANEYPGMRAPSFRCEPDANDSSSLLLHYYSERWGLHDIVIGIIKSVAKDEYGQYPEITFERSEHLPKNGMTECYHAVFRIKMATQEDNLPPSPIPGALVCPSRTLLNSETFCQAFPFHMVIDSDMMIVQAGVALQRLVCIYDTTSVEPDPVPFNDIFQMVRPHMDVVAFRSILAHIHTVFVVNTRPGKVLPGPEWEDLDADTLENETDDIPILRLKGEMVYESERNLLLYLSSPRIGTFSDLGKRGLSVSHIPIYDSTRELILHNNVYTADQERIYQLEVRTDELRRAQIQLLSANKRLDDLLYSILPVSVADRLRSKDLVEPERFDNVTVLMSDIVSYTKIGQECQAIDVIKMLQELYSLFDAAARRNNVYKVETVGDAYIVVGGIPEQTCPRIHARNVANQALDMQDAAKEVKNPRPGEGHVKIRIGIHTGMVYAGVVGVKMPRYCLFGRTVTMAQKAEGAAPHGGILATQMTYNWLKEDSDFQLIKGRLLSWTGSYNKELTCYTLQRGDNNEFEPLECDPVTEWMQRFFPPSLESSPLSSPLMNKRSKPGVARHNSKVRDLANLHTISAPYVLQKQEQSDSSDNEFDMLVDEQKKARVRKAPTLERPNPSQLQKPIRALGCLPDTVQSLTSASNSVSPDLVISPISLDCSLEDPSRISTRSTDSDSGKSFVDINGISYKLVTPHLHVSSTINYSDV